MTLGKHMERLRPTKAFKVAFDGLEETFNSMGELPESILDAELVRVTKDKSGCLVYEVKG
jgi:hypothetical protein